MAGSAHCLDKGHAAALYGVEQDHGGLAGAAVRLCGGDGGLYLGDIVAVLHVDDVPAEGRPLVGKGSDGVDLLDGAVYLAYCNR